MNLTTKPKLFTTKTCAKCPSVKKYLKRLGVDYEEVDVTENVKLIKEVAELSGLYTVPQLLVGERVVVGPNFGKIKEYIHGRNN